MQVIILNRKTHQIIKNTTQDSSNMKIFALLVISVLTSGGIGREALYLPVEETTTQAPHGDHSSQCTPDPSQETELLFNFGEPRVDQGASFMLLDQMVNGPLSMAQVNQVAIRLEEISRAGTSTSITPRCRFGEEVDTAAYNLLRWMTLNRPNAPIPTNTSQCTSDSQPGSLNSCEEYSIPTKRKRTSLDTMKIIVDLADKGKSEKTIKGKYPWFQRKDLPTFRKCVRFGGSNADKMDRINAAVLSEVQKARANKEVVHDYMIRQWGQRMAREVEAESFFRASNTWVDRFKKQNRVVARTITGDTGRHEPTIQLAKALKLDQFRQQYSQLEWYFPRHLIWNYDQTGFNYEITNKRTLSFKGERDTIVGVNQRSKTTHSYTSQPMITREGRTMGKLLLCLREQSGDFPETKFDEIKALERRYRNIHVVASKSGKMSKKLMEVWVKEVLIPAKQRALT